MKHQVRDEYAYEVGKAKLWGCTLWALKIKNIDIVLGLIAFHPIAKKLMFTALVPLYPEDFAFIGTHMDLEGFHLKIRTFERNK